MEILNANLMLAFWLAHLSESDFTLTQTLLASLQFHNKPNTSYRVTWSAKIKPIRGSVGVLNKGSQIL